MCLTMKIRWSKWLSPNLRVEPFPKPWIHNGQPLCGSPNTCHMLSLHWPGYIRKPASRAFFRSQQKAAYLGASAMLDRVLYSPGVILDGYEMAFAYSSQGLWSLASTTISQSSGAPPHLLGPVHLSVILLEMQRHTVSKLA
jgi:hypothetical protein